MRQERKPSALAWGWFTPGSNEQLWGEGGTYKFVPYEALPPLPPVGTDLAWLRAAPKVSSPLGVLDADGAPSLTEMRARLDPLLAEARALGLVVPPPLRRFMTDPGLHGRVPTATGCYIDLPARLLPLPEGRPGKLLRFMNDQQCCLLWYVHLLPGGDHQVVCATPEFDDDATGESLDDVIVLEELVVCAPSFDEFVHRFWLENTLWYANRAGRVLTQNERAYVDHAQHTRTSGA